MLFLLVAWRATFSLAGDIFCIKKLDAVIQSSRHGKGESSPQQYLIVKKEGFIYLVDVIITIIYKIFDDDIKFTAAG